ncbi:MAG TPA: ATP-binding protein [Gammaproteobacteria bacterium]|nr:ATP-binding protein [Gammaproteobacteria bacterium]
MTNGKSDHSQSSDKSRAQGSPTKDFFVRMITRDITLADCIMDLVDNAVDGARRTAKVEGRKNNVDYLKGFFVEINPTGSQLSVNDNCGGISLSDAINYAFHFGRKKDAPRDVETSIGLYGIGMKRAIFKIGRHASIESVTNTKGEHFTVIVDVDSWERKSEDWDFDIDESVTSTTVGTRITIDKIYASISSAFVDQSFINGLIKTMARDYAFILKRGFEIRVRTEDGIKLVPKYDYKLKKDSDFSPGIIAYMDEGVHVRIICGIANDLPNEIPDELRQEKAEYSGWYVICNDRVVVAGDKTDLTVWGNNDFPGWHPQYNGFAGFLFMSSEEDASKLPWKTTKREVDTSDLHYQRAITHMKSLTRQFIDYTNARKGDPETAKKKESQAASVSITEFKHEQVSMRLPSVNAKVSKEKTIQISFSKPIEKVKKAADAMGDFSLSAREVGSKAFDYFYNLEVEDK